MHYTKINLRMNMNNRLRTTLYEMDIRIHTVDVSPEADEVTYIMKII